MSSSAKNELSGWMSHYSHHRHSSSSQNLGLRMSNGEQKINANRSSSGLGNTLEFTPEYKARRLPGSKLIFFFFFLFHGANTRRNKGLDLRKTIEAIINTRRIWSFPPPFLFTFISFSSSRKEGNERTKWQKFQSKQILLKLS